MDKLTLDTNVLIDWGWCEGRLEVKRYDNDEAKREELRHLFTALKAFRDEGICEFGVTTVLYADYSETSGNVSPPIQDMIGSYVDLALPSIFGFPLVFPTVFADEQEAVSIFREVFPHSKPGHKRYNKNWKDAGQLYAHKVAGRDFFITADKAIISKRLQLAQNWGIEVRTLNEYVLEKQSRQL